VHGRPHGEPAGVGAACGMQHAVAAQAFHRELLVGRRLRDVRVDHFG